MTNPTAARVRLVAYVSHESDADQAEFLACVDAVATEAVEKERQERLADHRTWQHDLGTLRAAQEELEFLQRNTLPELRRTIQHHEDGKQRWRGRAEKAEAEAKQWQATFGRDALRDAVTEMDRLRTQVAAVLALHPKHTDSEHCQHDGEPWPCPTVQAAGASTPATIESKSSLSPTSAAIVAAGPLCTCRKFPAAHRADLHDEDGLVRDIEPVPSVGWPAMKHAKCTRCGWTSASSWLEFDRWVAQSAIADQHRDRWTDECLPEATS